MKLPSLLLAACTAAALAGPAAAQNLTDKGGPDSPGDVSLLTRFYADPGTFWLDGDQDRELIRYSHPRDVRLCLPKPAGVAGAKHGYALMVHWDPNNTATLFPGNCLYFDATRVSVKPAEALPQGVVLQGRVDTNH